MIKLRHIVLFLISCSLLSPSQSVSAEEQTNIRKIPVAKGLASHPVNGGPCLISDGEYQYLAFYDGDHQLTVGKRKLSETNWDFAKLPERVGWDTHNKILLFQDRKGYLHLTGNMHCAPLKYYRTKVAGDIHTFEGIHTWSGDYENRVTYPTLFQLRDGSIYIMYRHGGSGNGMRIVVHYDEETQRWTKTVPALTNGMDRKPTCNAYPFGLLEDNNGVWHFAWCWRETPDVVTNFDVCYARSLDRGVSWTTLDGRKLELPITPENAGVVDPIPQQSGLMNGGTFVVDAEGRPYIGYTRFDKDGYNQLYVATPIGDTWKIIQLTDWKHRFYFEGRGTIPESPPTPRLSITPDRKIEINYSNRYAKPTKGRFVFTREQLLTSQPGQSDIRKSEVTSPALPNIRAVNRGPLPEGQTHYMQQQTDRPNRDRKPETPREPTMIYLVEVINK
ncbi:MAG: BNR repeat-containing protein [Sedimentisphaerales bacterium]|nr:BNR repeat-containing protein [Sedimentisphaerales bacterium]